VAHVEREFVNARFGSSTMWYLHVAVTSRKPESLPVFLHHHKPKLAMVVRRSRASMRHVRGRDPSSL
jgi:hypothetical protein